MPYDIKFFWIDSKTHNELTHSEYWEYNQTKYLEKRLEVLINDNEIVISCNKMIPMAFVFEETSDGQFENIAPDPCLRFYDKILDELHFVTSNNSMIGNYLMNNEE